MEHNLPKAPTQAQWQMGALILANILVAICGGIVAKIVSLIIGWFALIALWRIGQWSYLTVRNRYGDRLAPLKHCIPGLGLILGKRPQ